MNHVKIFDAHSHAFPEKIAAKAMARLSKLAGIPYHHNGTLSALYEYEHAGGASAFLLLPIATRPESVRSINEWAAGQMKTGLFAFGTLHPDCADISDEALRIARLGLKGVKLHPEYQNFFVDEERLFPLYEAVFDLGLPICFHSGADLGFPPPLHGDARRIAVVADRFPNGRIIAAHMGGLFQFREVLDCLAGRPNVWMDTSFAAERMRPEDIATLIHEHGSNHFFFGTDAPWSSFSTSRDALLAVELTSCEREDIFWNNAVAFFGL